MSKPVVEVHLLAIAAANGGFAVFLGNQEKAFVILIVGPKLFIEPGTKALFQLSSVSGPGL